MLKECEKLVLIWNDLQNVLLKQLKSKTRYKVYYHLVETKVPGQHALKCFIRIKYLWKNISEAGNLVVQWEENWAVGEGGRSLNLNQVNELRIFKKYFVINYLKQKRGPALSYVNSLTSHSVILDHGVNFMCSKIQFYKMNLNISFR